MAKTKTKMELVPTEETKEFKKQRMLEIRTIVARALKDNKRIDLMDFEGTDIPRVIVALQDEVMKARERHTKATKHICEAKRDVSFIMPVVQATIEMQGMVIENLLAEAEVQAERIEDAHEHSITLFRENEALRQTVEVLR